MIKLTKEELEELQGLTTQAEHTPVIAMSLKDGMMGRDWATLAWNRVRDKWHALGRKYTFNPSEVRGIDRDTGEVLF